MKIVEITGNLSVALTNEEADLLLAFKNKNVSKLKSELSERQVWIANGLVNKNVLRRTQEDGRLAYRRTDR